MKPFVRHLVPWNEVHGDKLFILAEALQPRNTCQAVSCLWWHISQMALLHICPSPNRWPFMWQYFIQSPAVVSTGLCLAQCINAFGWEYKNKTLHMFLSRNTPPIFFMDEEDSYRIHTVENPSIMHKERHNKIINSPRMQYTCHLCPLQTPSLECDPCHHLSCFLHQTLEALFLFCKHSKVLSLSTWHVQYFLPLKKLKTSELKMSQNMITKYIWCPVYARITCL